MAEDKYKQVLREMVESFGVGKDELKYWDLFIDRTTKDHAKGMVEILEEEPGLFMDLHHNLIKKALYLKTRGTEADWQEIMEEEKNKIKKIFES